MPAKGTRITSQDVGRYTHKDTGTAGKPQMKSAKMAKGETRKTTGGGASSPSPDGMHKSAKMKSTRVSRGSY